MTQSTALSILKLGHTTFLTGPAGSGKSYVLREYIDYLKKHNISYAVTASTGIASTHINGTTIHSWSGIGIKEKLTSFDLDNIEEKPHLYKRWNNTNVLIIDEISMLRSSFIDMLDILAKHMRRNTEPFGGLQIVFCGDFFQLPPIVRGDNDNNKNVFAFNSKAWAQAKPVVCYLTDQYRQKDDILSLILNSVRDGNGYNEYYGELLKYKDISFDKEYVRLYTHNENVDEINNKAFDKLEGKEYVYHMKTKGKANLVSLLKNNCLADESLRLKVGAKVICIKNAQDRSYVNGSMGIISSFDKDNYPVIDLVSGKKITVKEDSWKIEEDGKVKAEISQLPLKLAWAITVHKSQGMTLDRVEIDLSRSFVKGQGYVALSRLTSIKGLSLKGLNEEALEVSDDVLLMDKTFKLKSDKAEDAFNKYKEDKIKKLQEENILKMGGSIKEVEVKEDEILEKVPSYLKTKEFLEAGLSLVEIAEKRSLSVDTIIGHIEKLIEAKEKVFLDKILPKKKELEKITKSFKKLDTRKLTSVYDDLGGKVEYNSLRIVRAYLDQGE